MKKEDVETEERHGTGRMIFLSSTMTNSKSAVSAVSGVNHNAERNVPYYKAKKIGRKFLERKRTVTPVKGVSLHLMQYFQVLNSR